MKRLSALVLTFLFTVALGACGSQPAAQPPTTTPAPAAAPVTTAPASTTAPAPTTAPVPTAAPVAEAPGVNLTEGCVTDYDPQVDYFPEKVTLRRAEGFNVEYHNNYKVLTVSRPYPGATETFRYILVQCGTPAPSDVSDAQVTETPVKTIAALSTVQFADLIRLGLLDRLVAVQNFKQINSPEVLALVEAGKLQEIGGGSSDINIEAALDLQPDLVMTFAASDPTEWDHPRLLEVGLKTVIHSSWLEEEPLARAEWIKYMSVFFNKEAEAERIFTEMEERYTAMAEKAQAVADKPTVFTGFMYKGSWYISGGRSYFARMLVDAGANYLWADNDATGSPQLSFEEVFERASDADFWVNASQFWTSAADVLKGDERYAQFAAFQNGHLYNNNLRLNETGGNDYWESGVANPDVILADLIKIFHPELLPDHELVYYRQIKPEA